MRPKVQLSRLREIGFSLWDPIGLAPVGDWREGAPVDEYDRYLLEAVSCLRDATAHEECVHHLVYIETIHMGLGERDDTLLRASNTIIAIKEYLATLPDGLPRGR